MDVPVQNRTMSTSTPPPTSKSSPYKAPTIFTTLHTILTQGLHSQIFKSGAFSASIPYTTALVPQAATILTTLNILLASPLLSASEKEIVKNCKIQFIHLRNQFPRGVAPGTDEARELMERTRELKDMFERDAESRAEENVFDFSCELVLLCGELES